MQIWFIQMILKILIAEDNEFTRLQYDKIFSKYGHKVTLAKDGDECLKKYEDGIKNKEIHSMTENPFDVVILDQSMPKKKGSEVAEKILSIRPTQRILIASANALTSERDLDEMKQRVEFIYLVIFPIKLLGKYLMFLLFPYYPKQCWDPIQNLRILKLKQNFPWMEICNKFL